MKNKGKTQIVARKIRKLLGKSKLKYEQAIAILEFVKFEVCIEMKYRDKK